MKKFITLLLVLTGMVSTASAWTGTLKGSFDSWGSGVAFTAIGNWEMYVKISGDYIHSSDVTFKPTIDGKGWRGPKGKDSDWEITPNGSTVFGTDVAGDHNFLIKKNANATDIYVHLKTYDDGKNDWWEVKVLVVESYTSYPIKFSSTLGSVSAYRYYNDIPLHGTWPGESLTTTSGSCSATLSVLPGSKVIFTNGEDGDANKTDALDVVRNGVYSKANGLSHISTTITSAGYATFSSEKAVDFTGKGVDAYIASAITDNKVVLTKHNKVPSYNGVLLKGSAGTYDIPVTDSPDDIDANMLMATVLATEVAASTSGTYHYVLANSSGIGFYNVATATTSAAGKAYLETATALASETGARAGWIFEDEPTGIQQVETAKVNDNAYFNLAGQRVAQPTKGLYIVNGKKVIIK